MNIIELRNKNSKRFLTSLEEYNLTKVLTLGCSRSKYLKVNYIVKHHFFSYLLEQKFMNRFSIVGTEIEYKPKDNDKFREELKLIREEILEYYDSNWKAN